MPLKSEVDHLKVLSMLVAGRQFVAASPCGAIMHVMQARTKDVAQTGACNVVDGKGA